MQGPFAMKKPLRTAAAVLGALVLQCAATLDAGATPSPVALTVTPAALGSDWQQTKSGAIIFHYSLAPIGEHSVQIAFDDGSTAAFDFDVTPNTQVGSPITFVAGFFTPRAGTTGTLSAAGMDILHYDGGAPGTGTLLSLATLDLFDPQIFQYTFVTGESISLDRSVLPTSVPAPAALALFGFALVGIGALRRYRSVA